MKSLQLTDFGKPLQWNEYETPEPVGKEVLVKVSACGVCHSDLHIWEGYYELGGEERIYVKERGVNLPLTMGHEVVGVVEAAGPDVTGVKPGDKRLVYPWVGCGTCKYCRSERPQMCSKPRSLGVYTNGGYSSHVLVPDAQYLVNIDGLRDEQACSYACAGLTAYSALKKAMPLESDETLVLVGAGGLGLMAVQVVRELTDARVIMMDIDDEKLETVRSLTPGVETLNTSQKDAVSTIMEMTANAGANAVIDFVNNEHTAKASFGMLAKNGQMIMVGLFGGKLTFPTPVPALKNQTIRGSYTGSLVELRELIDIIKEKDLRPVPVKTYPMDEAASLLDRVKDGKIIGRAVLTP
ncbi:MAG: alcohol dehydrogenase catalytic domain-containing protein [Bacteroidetes bacterium]|nr:alcohol dehydrogenase catalytic domain-containing protein [Bacteroidota bacterium]MCH8524361.1 alcohol dehydrogenase [Balneolales bacterium]